MKQQSRQACRVIRLTTKEIADRFRAIVDRKNYKYDLEIVAGVYIFRFK